MSLYDIDMRYEALMESSVDPETGELLVDPEELKSQIEALEMERETKLENVALAYKNYTADAKAIAEEIKALQKRKQTAENKAESCKAFLMSFLDGQKFKTPKVAVSYHNSTSTVITDIPAFIEWAEKNNDTLLKYKDPEPNKTEIKKLLDAGKEVDFCQLQNNTSVVIK